MEYLTVDSVRERLGYRSKHTIRRMVARGVLTAYKIPGSTAFFFKQSDVDAALKKLKPNNKPKPQKQPDPQADA